MKTKTMDLSLVNTAGVKKVLQNWIVATAHYWTAVKGKASEEWRLAYYTKKEALNEALNSLFGTSLFLRYDKEKRLFSIYRIEGCEYRTVYAAEIDEDFHYRYQLNEY